MKGTPFKLKQKLSPEASAMKAKRDLDAANSPYRKKLRADSQMKRRKKSSSFLKGKDYYTTTYDKDGNIIGNMINDCELGKGPLGAGAGYNCSGGAFQRDNSMYDGQFYYFFPSRPNYPLD